MKWSFALIGEDMRKASSSIKINGSSFSFLLDIQAEMPSSIKTQESEIQCHMCGLKARGLNDLTVGGDENV
jgi:hypothetical protein